MAGIRASNTSTHTYLRAHLVDLGSDGALAGAGIHLLAPPHTPPLRLTHTTRTLEAQATLDPGRERRTCCNAVCSWAAKPAISPLSCSHHIPSEPTRQQSVAPMCVPTTHTRVARAPAERSLPSGSGFARNIETAPPHWRCCSAPPSAPAPPSPRPFRLHHRRGDRLRYSLEDVVGSDARAPRAGAGESSAKPACGGRAKGVDTPPCGGADDMHTPPGQGAARATCGPWRQGAGAGGQGGGTGGGTGGFTGGGLRQAPAAHRGVP